MLRSEQAFPDLTASDGQNGTLEPDMAIRDMNDLIGLILPEIRQIRQLPVW